MPFRRRDMPERRRSPRYIGLEKPSDDDFPDAVASSDEQSFTQLRGDDETYLEIESTADYHNESSTIEAPSVSEILRFAISAVAVFLCGPILSLIDTSAVGLLSGSSQLAALNPAVSVTEYSALLIAFLYTGTTNLIAASQEKDKSGSTKSRTADIFISALQLSGFVGAALGAILLTLSVPILKAIIGNNSIDPNIFSASLKYVRIRALGMPAAAFIGTAQAACLGMRDSKSPLYVLFAAAVVNFLGDICLVGNSNAWIGGAAGAAWATVVSQYAAVFFFVRLLCHDRPAESKADVTNIETTVNRFFPKKSSNDTIEEQNSPSKTEASRTKGFLKGKFRASVVFHLPSRDSISGFIPYIVPVTCTQVGRVSSYVSMSHVISSTLGTTSMAAQQVIISSWNCLYPVGESLSLTAQSFLPSIVERPMTGKNRASLLKKTLMNFWKSGLIFGSGLFATALCLPRLNPLLTSDPTVMASVNSVVPLLLVIYSTIGIFTSSEGMLLGQKDLGFLGKSYTSFFFIVPYFMLRLKRAALNAGSKTVNLKSVWTVFTCYQVFRTIMWALRALYLVQREGETGQR
jgi:Na+-driven multidrug efflux pump